jgi:hypothetical protein
MHSLKQTVIAVMLLGLSFGLYQVSLTPSNLTQTKTVSDIDTVPGSNQASLLDFSSTNANNDTSSGLAMNNSSGKPATGSLDKLDVPSLPTSNSPADIVGSSSKLSIPKLPALPVTIPEMSSNPGTAEFQSKPIDSARVSSSLASAVTERSQPDSKISKTPSIDFSANHPAATDQQQAGSQMVQREPEKASVEQGLIDALKTQSISEPKNVQDFVPAPGEPAAKQSRADGDFVAFAPTSQTPPIELLVNNTTTPSASGFSAEPATNPARATAIASSFMGASNQTQPASTASSGPSSAMPISTDPAPARAGMTASEMAQYTYKTVWLKIDELVAEEDYHTALKLLSRFYRDESLNGPQRQRLLGWLDALAGKVIFSEENHLKGEPYAIQPQESLADVAKRWQVPVQLFASVHGESFENREVVPPGTKLKEIPGPFHAELNLESRVITLFLGDLYAGRFPVVIGTSGEPVPGKFDVVLKSETGYDWYDEKGKSYPPGSIENGYGPHWIGLSGELCIHAVPDNTTEGHRGCIGLSREDAADLFSILSETSKLTIVP